MKKYMIPKKYRIVFSMLIFAITFIISYFSILRKESDSAVVLSDGEIAARMIALPGALAILALTFTGTAAAGVAPLEAATTAVQSSASHKSFMAQVVGVQWLNPLQRSDYPIEWQLLWTLGQATPNPDDEMVREKPDKYRVLGPVTHIADANDGAETFSGFHKKYLRELTVKHRDIYFSSSTYFYNAHSLDDKSTWRELAGIHVEYAIPIGKLDSTKVKEFTRDIIAKAFDIGNPNFPNAWTRNTPPDVRITMGDANVGFTSLSAGLAYLQSNPTQTVWVMNWDAPSFPKDTQLDENIVLLILAGPDYKTGRAPLAWLSHPVSNKVSDFETKPGSPSRAVQAWKTTLNKAIFNANKRPVDIGFVIHDANSTHPKSTDRLAPLAQTITEEVPDLDFMKHTFNTPALLGEMGAGSALTNVALGIAYANHIGKTVLVAGTTDPDLPTATVVVPPAVVRPIDPKKPWFRARSLNSTYLPWWGLRNDAKSTIQGDSR